MLNVKNKPALHLRTGETLVLTNETSGKQTTYRVDKVNIDEEFVHPVRVNIFTPEPRLPGEKEDKKTTSVVGFGWREQAEVLK